MNTTKQVCVDNSYANYTLAMMNTTVNRDGLGPGIRQWTYQTCTQFGYCKYTVISCKFKVLETRDYCSKYRNFELKGGRHKNI